MGVELIVGDQLAEQGKARKACLVVKQREEELERPPRGPSGRVARHFGDQFPYLVRVKDTHGCRGRTGRGDSSSAGVQRAHVVQVLRGPSGHVGLSQHLNTTLGFACTPALNRAANPGLPGFQFGELGLASTLWGKGTGHEGRGRTSHRPEASPDRVLCSSPATTATHEGLGRESENGVNGMAKGARVVIVPGSDKGLEPWSGRSEPVGSATRRNEVPEAAMLSSVVDGQARRAVVVSRGGGLASSRARRGEAGGGCGWDGGGRGVNGL